MASPCRRGPYPGSGQKIPLKNPKSTARVYPWPRVAGQDAYKMGSDAGLSLTANCTGAYADRRVSARIRLHAEPVRRMRVRGRGRMPILLRSGTAGGAGERGSMGQLGYRQGESTRTARKGTQDFGGVPQTRPDHHFHVERNRPVPGFGTAAGPQPRRPGNLRTLSAAANPAADAKPTDRARHRRDTRAWDARDRVTNDRDGRR